MNQQEPSPVDEPPSAVLDAFVEFMQLRALDRAPSFSEYCRARPALEGELQRLMRQWRASPDTGVDAPRPPEAADELPPDTDPQSWELLARIARRAADRERYETRGELARGGMGVIAVAWDRDLRRKLALKSMRTDSARWQDRIHVARTLARFLDEAQITGQLDHPGVVPVHELGMGEDGAVYFSMRLVEGTDLRSVFERAWSGRDGWNPTRVVGVLLKVCETMAYAHSKGVIHRDLKPSNIMAGRFGEVYVMDWGLARARGRKDMHDLRPDLGGAASASVNTDRREHADVAPQSPLVTMDGDVLGTPSYMPPEQARGLHGQIDERSDVYAVGAMLYELLTHQMPFAPEGGAVAPYAVLARVLSGPPPAVAQLASGSVPELVAICERAMAREPAQRYATMLDMADDLRAYLEGRVVRAYETGALAEARKWVRRNRGVALASAAAIALAILGTTATLYAQARGRTLAQAEADRAKVEAETSAEVTRVLTEMFEQADPRRTRGADLTAKELLDDAATRLERDLVQQPLVRARLQHTIARAYKSLGSISESRRLLESALEIRREELGATHPDTLAALEGLADACQRERRIDLALPLYEELARARAASLGALATATLSAEADVAVLLQMLGRAEDAERQFQTVLAKQRKSLGEDHADTLKTLNNLAVFYRSEGRAEEARALLERSLEAQVRVAGPDAEPTLIAKTNLAVVESQLGQRERAVARLREVLDARLRAGSEDHPDTLIAMRTLALMLDGAGERDEAGRLLRATLAARRRVFGDRPATRESLRDLALHLKSRGELEEAGALAKELLETTPADDRSAAAARNLADELGVLEDERQP